MRINSATKIDGKPVFVKQRLISLVRMTLLMVAGAALAACQSLPPPSGFTAAQIQMLQAEGFVPVDDSWHLTLPNRLLFSSDQSELSADKLEDIAQLARNLVREDIRNVVVEGHTDSTASDEYNLRLSHARAQTVAAPMTANGLRFSPEQIIGRGEAFPISSNDTAEGRQDNRRVVIIVSPD